MLCHALQLCLLLKPQLQTPLVFIETVEGGPIRAGDDCGLCTGCFLHALIIGEHVLQVMRRPVRRVFDVADIEEGRMVVPDEGVFIELRHPLVHVILGVVAILSRARCEITTAIAAIVRHSR